MPRSLLPLGGVRERSMALERMGPLKTKKKEGGRERNLGGNPLGVSISTGRPAAEPSHDGAGLAEDRERCAGMGLLLLTLPLLLLLLPLSRATVMGYGFLALEEGHVAGPALAGSAGCCC